MAHRSTKTAPNILLIMADQMAAPALPVYGHQVTKAPRIQGLADNGVVFENAYCNFPICAPSRYSLLSGRLPVSIGAFDNAAELPASVPTIAHYLTDLGYQTILCGKMHFVGPDQLHGYQERLVTDIYPSDFSWTPNWMEGQYNAPTGLSMRAVIEAGECVRNLQVDYDDEVEFYGLQKIYDLARRPNEQPFFLTVSFTHPHSPFIAPTEYWNRYRHEEIDLPAVSPIPVEKLDPWSRWLHYCRGMDIYSIGDDHVRNARHAYYGMISYVDDKVGRILDTLKATGLDRNTIVVFTADHGEMLGERGMWYKQTFYEWSARVPMVVSWPGTIKPGRERAVVSLVDLFPTLLDLATDEKSPEPVDPIDGHSLASMLGGTKAPRSDTAISEFTAEGTLVPCRMLRNGDYKYIYTHRHPGQLFNLREDPHELTNLADSPAHEDVKASLHRDLLENWDPEKITQRVLASQKRRLFLLSVARKVQNGPNWAFKVPNFDEARFVRHGGGKGAMDTKARSRLPYVSPVMPDKNRCSKAEQVSAGKDWLVE